MSKYQHCIGKKAAIAMYDLKWWEGKSAQDIARIGLFTQELCLPFDMLQKAVEDAIGRPVFTHEFGMNFDGICQELLGERDAPTLEEIINLIPENLRNCSAMITQSPRQKNLQEIRRRALLGQGPKEISHDLHMSVANTYRVMREDLGFRTITVTPEEYAAVMEGRKT